MSMEKDFRYLQVSNYIETLNKCLELNKIMHNWEDVEALEYAIVKLEGEINEKI